MRREMLREATRLRREGDSSIEEPQSTHSFPFTVTVPGFPRREDERLVTASFYDEVI